MTVKRIMNELAKLFFHPLINIFIKITKLKKIKCILQEALVLKGLNPFAADNPLCKRVFLCSGN